MSLRPIETVNDLHTYLYAALQLEHATIPPYLTALYSMHPGANAESGHVIRVVLVEEMLHLTLSANILNAVGGTPDLTKKGFVPSYPTYLPDGEADFMVGLQPFSKEAVKTFLKIERPARASGDHLRHIRRKRLGEGLFASYVKSDDSELHFYSIGEFYQEISRGIQMLNEEMLGRGETLFVGDSERQITPDYYYSGGGDVIPVVDFDSAQEAIRLITEQGEGFEDTIYDREGELSHYYRFEQLLLGRYYHKGDESGKPSGEPIEVDWDAVYPAQTDARMSHYPEGSELHAAASAFNVHYKHILDSLSQAYTGQRELLLAAVGDMFRIKDQATALIRNPIPGKNGTNAAPTFEVDAADTTDGA